VRVNWPEQPRFKKIFESVYLIEYKSRYLL
jgi:hypothetical protein